MQKNKSTIAWKHWREKILANLVNDMHNSSIFPQLFIFMYVWCKYKDGCVFNNYTDTCPTLSSYKRTMYEYMNGTFIGLMQMVIQKHMLIIITSLVNVFISYFLTILQMHGQSHLCRNAQLCTHTYPCDQIRNDLHTYLCNSPWKIC